jgi:murein DD-endopeptidase MepM/ murein hydrolase activator NlpD
MRIAIWSAVIVLLLAGIAAAGPSISLVPKRFGPGDIMIVKVEGASGLVSGTFAGKHLHFNEIGGSSEAIVGIDLGLRPGTYPLEVRADENRILRKVAVRKKTYPLQRLILPEDQVTLSPENEARVAREAKVLSAIWPVESERLWNGSFIDPLPGKELGTPFGVRRIINKIPKSSHSGVDVSADEGDPVLAPNDGVIVLIDEQFFSGNSVFIDHGQGIYSMFFHLSKVEVKPGQAVMKGDVIARVGATGRATGPHLHWGIRMQGAKVDPLQLIHLKLD